MSLPAAAAPAPSAAVAITSPASGLATNSASLSVNVAFSATRLGARGQGRHRHAQKHGHVAGLIVLDLGGKPVASYRVAPGTLQGTHSFAVNIAKVADGKYNLQAFAYRSAAPKGPAAASNVVPVIIDHTPPTIHAIISPPLNAAGWSRGPVTVTFTASDNLSGIASLTPPVTLSTNGAHQVTGTAVDGAGNSASTSVIVNIGQTPTITSISPSPAGAGEVVTIRGSGFGASQGRGYISFVDAGTTWGAPGTAPTLLIDFWSDTAIAFTVPTPSGLNGEWHVQPGTTANVTVKINDGGADSIPLQIGP